MPEFQRPIPIGTNSAKSAPPASASLPGTSEPSDAELVALVLKGDEAAATWLVRRYESTVYSVALRRVGEPAVALDLVQDTFVTAFSQLANLRDVSVLRAWLLGILRNHGRNLARSRKRAPQSLDVAVEAGLEPADNRPAMVMVGERLEAEESAKVVRELLTELAPKYREVLVMRYLDEKSNAEIAAELQCSVNVVEVTLHRARKALGEKLERRAKDAI